MTVRFCASCMAHALLDPSKSRLALPGCRSPRLAFCDGALHGCTVLVDEAGAVALPKAERAQPAELTIRPMPASEPVLIA